MHFGSVLGLQFLVSDSTNPFSKASKSNAFDIVGIRVPAAMIPMLFRKLLRLDGDSAINLVEGVKAFGVGVNAIDCPAAADRMMALIRR
jgi:hypothetical protein